jgi:hypothetical protein
MEMQLQSRGPEQGIDMATVTLHEAMERAIPLGTQVSVQWIAEAIKRDLTYTRKDGLAPRPEQILARVREYPQLL